tara:strand:+ start:199 stop:681 length:483 start_codon:yes stop_codon:yes gene_type:complete
MTPENPINELIVKYKPLMEKYQLPDFSKLNEQFDIEEIDPESEFLLRKIRRSIADKVANYLRFVEIILNPSNAPMFFFKLLKKIDNSDKESLTELYESLGNYELKMLSLDIEYNEQDEADFIKEVYKSFITEIKDEFKKTIEKLNNDQEDVVKVNGSYLG